MQVGTQKNIIQVFLYSSCLEQTICWRLAWLHEHLKSKNK
jgi:hypothetical protein